MMDKRLMCVHSEAEGFVVRCTKGTCDKFHEAVSDKDCESCEEFEE